MVRLAALLMLCSSCSGTDYVLKRELLSGDAPVDFCLHGDPPAEFWDGAERAGLLVSEGCDVAPELVALEAESACLEVPGRACQGGASGSPDWDLRFFAGGYVLAYESGASAKAFADALTWMTKGEWR